MSIGYPVSSENPNLDAKVGRFWRDSFSEYQLVFDEQGKVKEVATDPMTANFIVIN